MAWYISESNDLPLIVKFLLVEEWKCIQALSEIKINDKFFFPNKKDLIILKNVYNSKLLSLVFITSRGMIYPIFKNSIYKNLDFKDELIKKISTIKFHVHGVIGLSEDVNYFNKIISKRIRGINNYKLLYRNDEYIKNIDSKINVEKANTNNLTEIIELEYEYQKEEVLLKQTDLNKKAIFENFKNKLKHDDMYYIRENNRIISKGSTTYKSLNYTLIGGVFTLNKYRNKGYSSILLSFLINDQLNKGFKSALFVKDSNKPALHLYKKLGFKEPVSYQINYYFN